MANQKLTDKTAATSVAQDDLIYIVDVSDTTDGASGTSKKATKSLLNDYYNVETYGAVHDGITDDTVAVQAAIQACSDGGGGKVYFPNGVYIIGGALQNNVGVDLVDYNSQLYIPQVNFDDTDRITIELVGETQPNLFQTAGIGTSVPPNSGVILRSTIQGSGTRPSVICSRGASTNADEFNFNSFSIKNISIQITPNGSNKLTIGGVNCKYSAIFNAEYVTCFPYNLNLVNSAEPDVIDIVGIEMPKVNAEHINTLRNCSVGGFTHGYIVAEHTSAYDITSICCVYAFTQDANHHIGSYTKLSSYWNKYDFNVIGNSKFVVSAIQTEWISNSKWYDNTATVLDSSDLGKGKINYNIVAEGVGLDNSKFVKTGGDNILCNPISQTRQQTITTNSTLTIEDGKMDFIIGNKATQLDLTVPPDTTANWDIEKTIAFQQFGAGQIRFLEGSGVTIHSSETNKSNKQNSVVYLTKIAANEYVLSGDTEATAANTYADDFLTATGIVDGTITSAINDLVDDLVADSLMDKIKAIYPMVGGTATTHKYNLKDARDLDAAFRLSFVGGWTHASTGALPNGTTGYADTFLVPDTELTLDSISFSYYSRTDNVNASSIEMGSNSGVSGAPSALLRLEASNSMRSGFYNGNTGADWAIGTNTDSSGFFTGSRTSSTLNKAFRNGTELASQTATSYGSQPTESVYIGAQNNQGTADSFTNRECSMAIIADGLSAAEASTLNTIVTTFQTALSRNV